MKLALSFAVILALAGCASQPQKATLPRQRPLFSLTVTQGAFSGPENAVTGWFFFVEESAPIKGPFLCGYHLVRGEVRETLSTGSSSAKVVAAIDAIDFEPFNWKAAARHDTPASRAILKKMLDEPSPLLTEAPWR